MCNNSLQKQFIEKNVGLLATSLKFDLAKFAIFHNLLADKTFQLHKPTCKNDFVQVSLPDLSSRALSLQKARMFSHESQQYRTADCAG